MQTPIYLAAVGGHQEVLKMLISHGGDINAKDSLHKTALHRYLLLNRPLPLILGSFSNDDGYGGDEAL